ncbi:HD domain-containing protein [Acidaminococcus fermentans]|uniref:HD domain-containing protein n=1 Tax=Acidaminococcus fermentans TaxID=905 RepID=UPI00242CAD70|nr:HD domain-containing protein [Acidaminococcus fermentans]
MSEKSFLLAVFDRYVSRFDPDTPGILSKQRHSRIVSSLCENLARELGWTEREQELAWVMGLLHDIGRFEQARRFHTFIDYKSMDHARYGVWYLFEQGHIRDFLPQPEPERDRILELSILWHNGYVVPAGVTGRARDFALLLRDADKIDLFRVYARYLDHPEQVWQVSLEDLGSQAISPKVLEEALAGKLVHTEYKKTALDFFTGCLCQLFDVTYGPSREIICRQGYFAKLLGFQPGNPKSARQLEQVKVKLRHWLVSGPPTLVR